MKPTKHRRRRWQAERKRWWHAARSQVKRALQRGEQPADSRHRHGQIWDRS